MSRRKKSIILLAIVFAVITITGAVYTEGIQRKNISKKEKQLALLQTNYSNTDVIRRQLKQVEKNVIKVDSILFSGNYTIPQNLVESDFFNFVDRHSRDYSLYTFTNTEYVNEGVESGFKYYTYKVSGTGAYDNVYKLVYAIEHSKELKKIMKSDLSSTTAVDNKGIPRFLVRFALDVRVYFSSSDLYAEANFVENNLYPSELHDAFFPLVRTEIRPNVYDLPDIQDATLLSLVPQGAFLSDSKGNTFLMEKGDPVYLGYLTDIDYDTETVTFILNKGGIIEYQTLHMGKQNKKEGQKK